MQMDAEQLRIEIAKAKGYAVKADIRDYGNAVLLYHNGSLVNWSTEEAILWNKYVPDWPTSIADAWELWNELPGHKVIYTMPFDKVACGYGGSYLDWDPRPVYPYMIKGNDTMLAISRAWLIWKAAE